MLLGRLVCLESHFSPPLLTIYKEARKILEQARAPHSHPHSPTESPVSNNYIDHKRCEYFINFLISFVNRSTVQHVRGPSGAHVVWFICIATSWYASTLSVWRFATRFLANKTIQANRFYYDVKGSFECRDDEVATILETASFAPLPRQAILNLQRIARSAVVHTEAVLAGCDHPELSDAHFTVRSLKFAPQLWF